MSRATRALCAAVLLGGLLVLSVSSAHQAGWVDSQQVSPEQAATALAASAAAPDGDSLPYGTTVSLCTPPFEKTSDPGWLSSLQRELKIVGNRTSGKREGLRPPQ
jgi:hypothetical protein